MARTEDELFREKSEARLRIYAYAIHDEAHEGLLKVGQTTRSVKKRVEDQLKTAAIKNYEVVLDELAERPDGTTFTDHEVRDRLKQKGFANPQLEWMRCTKSDVLSVVTELRTGQRFVGSHHQTFKMRPEQQLAVKQTHEYFHSIWKEDMQAVPRFLWNAKMRFGKTFSTYQLAKKLNAKKVLILTFKPAVEDAWRTDLESHVDFKDWQYLSVKAKTDPREADSSKPLVYFASFQDVLGRDKNGNIKPKNEWLHELKWDLVVFDEYHFGAHRETAQELFEGEDESEAKKEAQAEYGADLDVVNESLEELSEDEIKFLPITTRAFLYLSGTPFRALASGEFIEEQIFNWTYSDEQRAKQLWFEKYPDEPNPYEALPEMQLWTYQMPDELLTIASQGQFDEFDLNEFFRATGTKNNAVFVHKNEVQKWLDLIRGSYSPTQVDNLKLGSGRPPFPYSDARILADMNHSLWFLPTVASVYAMANLLNENRNTFFHDYVVLPVAGPGAGVGLAALPPVREAIGDGYGKKTITLTCGKLTTGVTVPQWSAILMLRNLQAPESYFQAAFRVQSPWAIANPNGDNPNEYEIKKPICRVFDFAPTRALRQMSEYAIGLAPDQGNPELAVQELVGFLPVIAYDGSHMAQVDAGGILDMAMAGISATLLAKKWDSHLLVNVDNDTLKKIINDKRALDAIMKIEGFRAMGSQVFETIVNKSEQVKETKREKGDSLGQEEKKELSQEEKTYKSLRKQVLEKLKKFATRIPAFMYLTDFRENTLQDVITKLEPDLFKTVTGLTVEEFDLLRTVGVFNESRMNAAVFAFRRYEDSSLSYTGIDSHDDLTRIGLFNTAVPISEIRSKN